MVVRKAIKKQLKRVEAAVRRLHKLILGRSAEPEPKKKKAKKRKKKRR